MPITLNLPQKDDEEIGHAPRPHSFFHPVTPTRIPHFLYCFRTQAESHGGWERRNLTSAYSNFFEKNWFFFQECQKCVQVRLGPTERAEIWQKRASL
jgi:hypothetical protein